ncbi:ferrous iron transport protein B [Saccharibacillus sp. CPCC 101409]|uniref:ferrous iron transport protein B n=1 Tax=Saccharibacillus sp. CPCC 101409 TaxID=3058041 RepID=UPI0026723C25|nr:ferrous iron transport protein B [Saccharibacillus sp. CPCC 101409]MDO3408756.1 ferrous iron transport protein B [Saccharibacillus sp. CPCC 101409]
MSDYALLGNPNTGKTSLFNMLTRSYETVGNWSGVTVEKRIGTLRGKAGRIVDLPGLYSLLPLTEDEGVAARFLMEEADGPILNIVDASQLERNLYLTMQLLEYGKPVMIGLNMVDVARARGIDVDAQALRRELGVPVVPIVARKGTGCSEVLRGLGELGRAPASFRLDYGPALEAAAADIAGMVGAAAAAGATSKADPRWTALQLLEGNPAVRSALPQTADLAAIDERIRRAAPELERETGGADSAAHIRQVRRQRIAEICGAVVDRSAQHDHTATERIDSIVTHRLLGIPLFLALMYLIFKLTFDWLGSVLSDVLDGFISGPLSQWISYALTSLGAAPFTQALVVDGIVGGVGGVLVFLPQIFILFLLISFIEDSGYMSRITLLMDRTMEAVGLSGKAFIPFIIGFGCNVPAIMAARTMEQRKDRLLTTLLVPLMSCSARLPVYALFAGVFFVSNRASVVMGLYVLGMVLALALAKLFSRTLLKSEPSVFVVELPPYRMPQLLSLLRMTWEKVKGFLRKAGTIILAGSVVIWFLSNTGPGGFGVDMNDSFLAYIGGALSTLLIPLGFGTWQAGAALITGFMAKEIVVSTMNIIYQAPDMAGLEHQVALAFTPLQAFSFVVFILLYIPCLATVGVIRKETSSWRWTFFSMGYSLALAYLVSLLLYQGGHLLGFV